MSCGSVCCARRGIEIGNFVIVVQEGLKLNPKMAVICELLTFLLTLFVISFSPVLWKVGR